MCDTNTTRKIWKFTSHSIHGTAVV
jgi:hypothetical protein